MKMSIVTQKYLSRIAKYCFIILMFIVVAYGVSKVVNVPAEYIILPLTTAVAGTMFSTRVNRLIDSVSFFIPEALLDENAKALRKGEERIIELKSISEQNKSDEFEELIREIDTNINIYQATAENSTGQSFANLFVRDIKRLALVPSASRSTEYQLLNEAARHKIREEYLSKLRVLLAPYAPASRKLLAEFITELLNQICPLFNMQQSEQRTKPLLLSGPPGIGKTHLIQTLSEIFQLPICKINMGNFNIEIFEGKQTQGSSGFPTPQPGEILKALTSEQINPKGYQNLILLLDEVDKGFIKGKEGGASERTAQLIGLLHPLLQTDIKTMHDKGYNIPINMSYISIICTSNRNCFVDDYIEPTTQKSLMDRVSHISMPRLSREAKLIIMQKKLGVMLSNDKSINLPIHKFILKLFLERTLDGLIVEDQNGGLRDVITRLQRAYEDSLDVNLQLKPGCKSIVSNILELSGHMNMDVYCALDILDGEDTSDEKSKLMKDSKLTISPQNK